MPFRYTLIWDINPNAHYADAILQLGLNIDEPDHGVVGRITIHTLKNSIVTHFDTEQLVKDVHTLRNIIQDSSRTFLDVEAYLVGVGYDLQLRALIGPEGNPQELLPEIPVLADRKDTSYDRRLKIMELMRNQVTYDYFNRLFRNFREAIRSTPTDTGFYCYRAIEVIRQFFARMNALDPEKDKDMAWQKMRDTLSVDREDLEYVKKFAGRTRHGNNGPISDSDRAQIFVKTRSVIDAFLAFLESGDYK